MIIKLNLARNCLRYIIKAYGIKEIYIPYYSCPVLWQAARQEGCYVKFYRVNEKFEPDMDFSSDAYILYINYFGVCSNIAKTLALKYKNLIVDNTHAYYSEAIGLASFNSLRKFFKIQNGAYLCINKKLDEKFKTDTINLIPVLFHEAYSKFVQNELFLNDEKEIKLISKFVEKQIETMDFNLDINQRKKLFLEYKNNFDKYNMIDTNLSENDIPYCYPLKTENEEFLTKLSEFNLLKLWDNDNIIALPLNDINYAKILINAFSE